MKEEPYSVFVSSKNCLMMASDSKCLLLVCRYKCLEMTSDPTLYCLKNKNTIPKGFSKEVAKDVSSDEFLTAMKTLELLHYQSPFTGS